MGGSAANRITNSGSGITGTSLGSAGGAETVTVAQANLPNITFPNNLSIVDPGHAHTYTATSSSSYGSGLGGAIQQTGSSTTNGATTGITLSGGVQSGGSGAALNKMPPTIIVNKIMRIV